MPVVFDAYSWLHCGMEDQVLQSNQLPMNNIKYQNQVAYFISEYPF